MHPLKSAPLVALALVACGSSPPPSAHPLAACPEGRVSIAAADFVMPSETSNEAASTAGSVHVDAFCMDRTEVTLGAYRACAEAGACGAPPTEVRGPEFQGSEAFWSQFCTANGSDETHPVNCVDWHEAQRFCVWAGGRLPSEVEWELAAHGATRRRFPWGEAPPSAQRVNACDVSCAAMGERLGRSLGGRIEFDDGWGATNPVEAFTFGATPERVYGMGDNVAEWVEDLFVPDANPPQHVVRGADWGTTSLPCVGATLRYGHDATGRGEMRGFRCASSL